MGIHQKRRTVPHTMEGKLAVDAAIPPEKHYGHYGSHDHYGHHGSRSVHEHHGVMVFMQFTVLIFAVCACVYGYYERQKRRRHTDLNGGYPTRTGSYLTSLFECISLPRICFPATFFTPFLAAFNRAEVDGRECHACDVLWSIKTPITQYQTRQSIRGQYKIQDAQMSDFLAAACCTPCAVAQDAIELERRMVVNAAAAQYVVQVTMPEASVAISMPEVPLKGDYSKVPSQCQV